LVAAAEGDGDKSDAKSARPRPRARTIVSTGGRRGGSGRIGRKAGKDMAKGKYAKWLKPDNLIRIEGWAREGAIDEEIAARMGINRATLYKWQKKYPVIAEAIAKGKDVADIEVENALYELATGYEYEEVATETDCSGGKTTRVVTKKVPPNVTAQIFWLKNRKPEKWRDKQDIGLAGDTELTIRVTDGS
jgi:hypothetical protein